MEISTLINEYAAGSQKLQEAIAGMTPEQINAAPNVVQHLNGMAVYARIIRRQLTVS